MDLRETDNVVDTATALPKLELAEDNDDTPRPGKWIDGHAVLKFQTRLFNGPNDYFQKVVAKFNADPETDVSERDVAGLLYVQPVHTSNAVAARNTSGTGKWAIPDYESRIDVLAATDCAKNVPAPLVGLKGFDAVLNTASDNIFTDVWPRGQAAGVYVPVRECSYTKDPSGALTGTEGVYIENGACGPIVPLIEPEECGDASCTGDNKQGEGCTDHRPFPEFWHASAGFGFVITDDPDGTIQLLTNAPGQRP